MIRFTNLAILTIRVFFVYKTVSDFALIYLSIDCFLHISISALETSWIRFIVSLLKYFFTAL